jgi:hypothetical protein
MGSCGVGVERGITLWAAAEDSGSESKSKSKAKSKAAGEGARSTSALALTPKQLGEIAEAEFIAKAVGLGFVVARPWGIASLMILL